MRVSTTPNHFRIADFITWMREGTLNLQPEFQRRDVWKTGARSYFIDSLIRGFPVPMLILRERSELKTKRVIRDVVDGQQRLRTIFQFVQPDLIGELIPLTISRVHNPELQGKSFDDLSKARQEDFLEYELSVRTLTKRTDDRQILDMFARLNSTGTRLNNQELRNAEYYGEFKTLMLEVAHEHLERWLQWKVFSSHDLSRMKEVELVSDLALNMLEGLSAKTKGRIDDIYARYEQTFPHSKQCVARFRDVMRTLEAQAGNIIPESPLRQEMYFHTLWIYVYDRIYGLNTSLTARDKARGGLPSRFSTSLHKLSGILAEKKFTPAMIEATSGAATDLKRRKVRLDFFAKTLS